MMTTAQSVDEPVWRIPDRLRLELLAHLSVNGTSTKTMSYEEFLDWADEDTLAEWVEGKVVMSSPAGLRHQDLVTFLGGVLAGFSRLHDLGRIVTAPFQMKLPRSGREPDVLFVANAHLSRLHPTFLDGPADLVVEVLSPESIGRDRGDKFFEYQAAALPEYWLIDPITRRAEFYQLDTQGVYTLVTPDANGIYRSSTLADFWLDIAWLWLDPLPRIEDALLKIVGEAYAHQLIQSLQRHGYLPSDQ
ncbi:MAG: Uma2 family endonuclease [Chloroflexota bacterium]